MQKSTIIIIIIISTIVLLLCGCCCSSLFFISRIEPPKTGDIEVETKKNPKANLIRVSDMKPEATKYYDEAEKLDLEGEYVKALESINKGLIIDPDSPALLDMKCYILIHLEDYDNALSTCEVVNSIEPNSPFTLSKLAQIHFVGDNCEGTVKYATELGKLEGIPKSDQRLLNGNAGVYLAECGGDKDLASKMLKSAISKTNDQELIDSYNSYLEMLNNQNI